MIAITYKNSSGKTYDLVGDKMRATSGGFHKYAWKPKTKEREFGDRLYGFTKESICYEMTLTLRGSLDERKKYLNELHESFERDVITRTPGTIYYGDYSIEAYIISSDTGTSDDMIYWSDCKIEIYCEYPFWTKRILHHFGGVTNQIISTDGFDYPYDYLYDWSNSIVNQKLVIAGEIPARFRMIIYGGCENPTVSIGELTYKVNTSLLTGEYLAIDTIKKKIIKVKNNGEEVNVFNERDREADFFEKIPAGSHFVAWSGGFSFDIELMIERSEPEWILSTQTEI